MSSDLGVASIEARAATPTGLSRLQRLRARIASLTQSFRRAATIGDFIADSLDNEAPDWACRFIWMYTWEYANPKRGWVVSLSSSPMGGCFVTFNQCQLTAREKRGVQKALFRMIKADAERRRDTATRRASIRAVS